MDRYDIWNQTAKQKGLEYLLRICQLAIVVNISLAPQYFQKMLKNGNENFDRENLKSAIDFFQLPTKLFSHTHSKGNKMICHIQEEGNFFIS